jgi:catechol 2,3-dioxygenase-like lactoylglutathione lyase family enzyme
MIFGELGSCRPTRCVTRERSEHRGPTDHRVRRALEVLRPGARLSILSAPSNPCEQSREKMFSRIDTVILRVRDLTRAEAWYKQTLGLSSVYSDPTEGLTVRRAPSSPRAQGIGRAASGGTRRTLLHLSRSRRQSSRGLPGAGIVEGGAAVREQLCQRRWRPMLPVDGVRGPGAPRGVDGCVARPRPLRGVPVVSSAEAAS